MKKLIIATAVVCTAVLTHAAAFTWSTANKAYMPYAIGNIAEGASQAAATSTNSKSMSNWADAGAVFAYTMLIDGVESTGTVTFDNRQIFVDANNGGFELPTDGSKTVAYDIVINGTYTDADDTVWTMTSNHITGNETYSSLSVAEKEYSPVTSPSGISTALGASEGVKVLPSTQYGVRAYPSYCPPVSTLAIHG